MQTLNKIVLITKEESEEKGTDAKNIVYPKWSLIDIKITKDTLVWCIADLDRLSNKAQNFKIRMAKHGKEDLEDYEEILIQLDEPKAKAWL